MPRYPTYSPDETLARQVAKSHAYLQRVLSAADRLRLPAERQRRLHALLGVDGCTHDMLLSDAALRIEGAQLLFDVVREQLPTLMREGTPMFHITFADDIGLMSDRTPVFKLAALRRKVDKAIRTMGLSAIVMTEVQPLMNHKTNGEGRTLMLHAHALCWGPVSRRKFRTAKKQLNASRSWSNTFGAKPIVSRRLHNGLEDALKIIAYVAKMPHDAKYMVPVITKSGQRHRFKPTITGYRDRLALRIAEGLSHYTIFDAVFGVGDGKYIRKAWKPLLVAWHRKRTAKRSYARKVFVAPFWKRLHREYGDGHYAPYAIG